MTAAELALRYRANAAECFKIAQTVPDEKAKLSLLTMAQSWIPLAEQSERNALVYEAPVAPPKL